MENNKPIISKKVKFVITMLKKYASEKGIILRSTSDLSQLEQWLLVEMYESVPEKFRQEMVEHENRN